MKDNISIDVTFKTVMTCSLVMGLLTNFYIFGVLIYLDLKHVVWSPIIGSILFVICYLLFKNNKITPQQAFLFTAYTVAIEIYIHTHFIGWNSGFYHYMYILPAAFFIYDKWEKWMIIFFNGSILLLTLILTATYINNDSPLPILSEIESYINLCNFFLTGIVVIVIIYCFKKTVLNKENDLLHINSTLTQQNLKVSEQHQNMQVLMKEIHHRVKNNLQMVNSLLRLQGSSIKDDHIAGLFKDSRQRILSMAMLHEKMYDSDDLQHINVYDHFDFLIKSLIDSYAIEKDINIDLRVDTINLEIDTLIPLGLMINEIITNSLKYAFKEQVSGKIQLHLKHLKDQEYEMTIGDYGIGVTFNNSPAGLGTKLIKIFVKQLNGTIEQLDTPGTLFRITFKNEITIQ